MELNRSNISDKIELAHFDYKIKSMELYYKRCRAIHPENIYGGDTITDGQKNYLEGLNLSDREMVLAEFFLMQKGNKYKSGRTSCSPGRNRSDIDALRLAKGLGFESVHHAMKSYLYILNELVESSKSTNKQFYVDRANVFRVGFLLCSDIRRFVVANKYGTTNRLSFYSMRTTFGSRIKTMLEAYEII